MRLQYELAATGENQIRAVLRGVEKEAAASNRRMAANAARTARQTTRSSASPMFGPGRSEQQAQLKAHERALIQAERSRLREAIASSKAETRARMADEKALTRARESLDRQRSRALFAQHKDELRARKATVTALGRGAARSLGGGVGRVAQVGGAALGLVGGFAAAGALAEQMEIRRRSAAIANKAGDPGLKNQLAQEAASVQGFSGIESLGALDAFMGKTGDLAAGRAALQGIGALALATDSNFEQMGEAAGNAFNVIGDSISDPQKRLEALDKVLRGWAGQGNIGAVEISDMAQFGGRLGSATRKFAGDPADLLLSMGAMSQAAVRAGGASDAAEATTGVARFASDLVKRPAQKALAGLGVDVFADKGKTKLRDPAQVIADMLDKTKGSLPMSEEIVNAESGKVLAGFSDIFTKAEAMRKGTGKGAVLAEFQRYKDAGLSKGQVDRDVASMMEEPDQQFKEAMKAFNTAVGRELLPAVTKLVPEFTKMIPDIAKATGALAKFVSFAAENPFAGIGAVVAASVAADVAKAGIGNVLSSMLVSMAAQTRLGAGLPGGAASGLAGKAGAAGAMVGGALLAYDQASEFGKENAGLEGFKGFLGIGTKGFGFSGVDEVMNRQAKERAASRPTTPASPAATDQAAAATKEAAAEMKDAAKAMKEAAGKMGGNKGVPEAARSAPIISPSRG